MKRRLLALNHFANPLDAPGGTRLIELAERLDGWDTTVVAASRNLFTRSVRNGDPGPATAVGADPGRAPTLEGASLPAGRAAVRYRTVWTTPYRENGPTRVVNWASYCVAAIAVGLREPRPDIVYASSPHLLTGLAGWAIARCSRARRADGGTARIPFVLEIRDLWPQILADTGRLDPGSPLYRAVRALERFLYGRADAIVVLTEGVARAIADSGVPAERIHLVPNGADPADFVPSRPRTELRGRYGFTGVTFVYAGAHGPANGLDFVLDAAAAVLDEQPPAQFVLVGDGLAKADLVDRVRHERLRNVSFLDPIPKSEIPDLLRAADVGLHVLADLPLFRYGVSPNKLFDYMAAGLPVLTNTAGEVGALVEQNDAGVATAPDRLSDGVRRIVGAGEQARAAWGDNGRSYIAAHRSRSLTAARLQKLLDHLAGQR